MGGENLLQMKVGTHLQRRPTTGPYDYTETWREFHASKKGLEVVGVSKKLQMTWSPDSSSTNGIMGFLPRLFAP